MSKRALTTIACAVVAAAAVAAAVPAPAAAGSGKPCWGELIDDWYDGRIDKSYPAHCYREAQKRVPRDAEAYSDLPRDLERGLAAALSGRGDSGEPPSPNTMVRPLDGLGRDTATGSTRPGDEDDPSGFGNDERGVLDSWAPANADSIPIPLLVLAALAVLLLITAVASYLARRWQTSRAPATVSSRSPDPRR